METWSVPTSNDLAYKRAGGRRRINRQRKSAAFWLGLDVWYLAWAEGLLPLEIAARLNIAAVTAYRHYWRYFGKRRPMIARHKALLRHIEAEEQRLTRLLESAKPKPVNRAKLAGLLEGLKQQSGATEGQ